MNILVIGKFYTEGFGLHIAETLGEMGHLVRRFDPGFTPRIGGQICFRLGQAQGFIYSATDSIPDIRARRIRSLWRVAAQGPLDVVIVCHDFLWPGEVTELKQRTRAAVAMWFPDSLANFSKGFFLSAPYDGLFFKDPYIVHALAEVIQSPVYYLPECFNPARHCLPEGEVPGDEFRCDITTAGNSHSWRVAFYRHLACYDVKLWGPPVPLWMSLGPVAKMHQGRCVLNDDKARAFLGARIVVNNLHYSEIWGLNVRTFETAGIGAFQMVNWRPGLGQLFEDKKELISFRGIDDLLNKVDYWLGHPEERLAVANAGKRRAHAEHTYRLRLSLLLDSLAQRSAGFPMPKVPYDGLTRGT